MANDLLSWVNFPYKWSTFNKVSLVAFKNAFCVRLKRKGNVISNVIENALKTVALLTSLKTARFFIKKF